MIRFPDGGKCGVSLSIGRISRFQKTRWKHQVWGRAKSGQSYGAARGNASEYDALLCAWGGHMYVSERRSNFSNRNIPTTPRCMSSGITSMFRRDSQR